MKIETALKNFDSPIQSFDEDLLQRRGYVENLYQVFRSASPYESVVFALYGEWGSGKTSVKNLLLKEMEKRGSESPIPIEFNPWAFSGQDQVLEAFFTEIGKAVGKKSDGKEAAEGFRKLGAYLSFGAKTAKSIHIGMDLLGIPGAKLMGLVGEGLEGGAKNAKQYGEDFETVGNVSLEKVQSELIKGLKKLNRPLLVILDDLDRLTPDQLLVMFQIVKLNANLPGVNYLILMDIETITKRLDQKGLGSEFVEKIVQFDFTMPHVSSEELKAILKDGFKAVVGTYEKQIKWERWEESWINGTQNLFTTLRRVKRFLHTLKFSLGFFANDDVLEVDPVDLFLIETVRKFAPETYALIPCEFRDSVIFEDSLMRAFRLHEREQKGEHGKKKLAQLIETSPKVCRGAIERILTLLFPQIHDSMTDDDKDQALRDSRICDQLSFDCYFRMAIPRLSITQQEMVNLFASLNSNLKFRSVLKALYEKAGLSNLFHRIYCHRDKFDAKYLSTFLAELWLVEDFDAKKDGVERDWSTRESAEQITRFFLREFSDKSNRCGIAESALAASKVLYPLVFMWIREHQILSQNPDSIGTAFDTEGLEKMRSIILKDVHLAASDGRLLEMPDLGFFMLFWKDMENKEAVQKWVGEQSQDRSKLVMILKSLINKMTISGHRGVEYRYSITRQNLEQFFDPIEKLEPLLSGLDTNSLPHWEKFAVEETLKRIDEKRRGIQEAKYPDI